jgi:hypothetical protein
VLEQLQNTGVAAIIGEENIYPEQAAVGAAMLAAETAAEAWIEEQK